MKNSSTIQWIRYLDKIYVYIVYHFLVLYLDLDVDKISG